MAVESRFVVIRHGVEAKTFMDKKSADEYDKMLDMADNLADVFAQSPIELSDSVSEELSIYLAQHREEVLVALLAKKPASKAPTKKAPKKAADKTPEKVAEKTVEAKPAKPATKSAKLTKEN
ncbi:YebG family protein [Colwellia sp. 6_MG-2023]|uniref:YebG family protein n=1 Tax=Colwellia sp. 6_MG-2023 TaxID=3062676 RepID=UPI0026E248C4|nr:YebG family protein [Colwellia sp. 6_MG-2023]MDO6487370.1 YebG family protein [Colwellia sp. 6_MG-2023]